MKKKWFTKIKYTIICPIGIGKVPKSLFVLYKFFNSFSSMKYKCAYCGSLQDEDPGTCCGEMREEMCNVCEEAVVDGNCGCDEEEEDMYSEDDDE